MIKKLVLVFLALFAIKSYAQEGTASPYSFYGIGSLKFKGSVENRSMGGLSVYTDSVHVNFKNPASFAGNNIAMFNNESRPVKFTVGGSHSSTKLSSNSGEDRVNSTTFDYIGISIPVGRFGVGIGLLPYTSVGYKLENRNELGNITDRFKGNGGLNKAFLAVGYQVFEGFSIGLEADYDFGNIQNSSINFLYNDDDEIIQYQSRETNRSDLSGLNFNIGVLYNTMVTPKLELMTSATFTPQADLTSKNERSFSTIRISTSTGAEFPVNTIEADLESIGLKETNLTLPSRFSFGVGVGEPRKWFAGVEHTTTKTSNFFNPLYANSGSTYEDGTSFSLGGFYIPQYNSFSSYWKRVVYRAGMRVENTGLKINNESIDEFGMSFGLGLPVGNDFLSNANLGLEFGHRGTTNNNLIKENFINFQLSLSLNDRWFQKRKYN
ncbi:hypothetical protein [Lacinutrix salivirga]